MVQSVKIWSGVLTFDEEVPEFRREDWNYARTFCAMVGNQFDGKHVLVTVAEICGEFVKDTLPPYLLIPCTLRPGHDEGHRGVVPT